MAAVAPAEAAQPGAMSEALQRFLREEEAAGAAAPAGEEEQLDLEHLDMTSTAVSLEGASCMCPPLQNATVAGHAKLQVAGCAVRPLSAQALAEAAA